MTMMMMMLALNNMLNANLMTTIDHLIEHD